MSGATRLPVEYNGSINDNASSDETGAVAAWNQSENKLYVLFYAYSAAMTGQGTRTITCQVSGLGKSGALSAVSTLISDDSNFYDDWRNDWGMLGITENDVGRYSSDGFVFDRSLFGSRYSYYEACSTLHPENQMLQSENGTLEIETDIPVHGVLLYEITVAP
jgi:hypothetical protein